MLGDPFLSAMRNVRVLLTKIGKDPPPFGLQIVLMR